MGNKENICCSHWADNECTEYQCCCWHYGWRLMYSEGIKAHHNSIIIESQADQGTGSWHSGSGLLWWDQQTQSSGLRRVNNGQRADGAIWRVERLSMSNESDYWHQIWSGWLWHRKYVSGIMVFTARWHPDPCPHLHLAQSEFMFEILNSQFVEARKLKQWSLKIGFKSAC